MLSRDNESVIVGAEPFSGTNYTTQYIRENIHAQNVAKAIIYTYIFYIYEIEVIREYK